VLAHLFARTPNVKYIFSHAGDTILYLATRFSIIDEMNVIPGAEKRGTKAGTLHRRHLSCGSFAEQSAWAKCFSAPTIPIFAAISR
jgi:hypothetical protein